MRKAYLVLENGATFCGEAFGAAGEVIAEVVFATGMTGYLETLTDKSYLGQMIVQTFPLIGNYGVIPSDFESDEIAPMGYIVKEWCQVPSNFRSEGDLDTFFKEKGLVGLCGIDTRALTKVLREEGVMNGAIVTDPAHADLNKLRGYRVEKAVERATAKAPYTQGSGTQKIALVDYGLKRSALKQLCLRDVQVTVFPETATAAELAAMGAKGIVLMGGPGDPAECPRRVARVREMLASGLPVMGVGLGHQLMALASGFETEKLKYGHRGANQPVKDLQTGRVYITGQNHGYVVKAQSVDPQVAEGCFANVNDRSCEGLLYKKIPALSVQFYPESGGGTMDTSWLYDRFVKMTEEGK